MKSGAVSEDNADDPVKISLARAARTDAGVHAGGNVVNMKLITSPPGVDDLVTTVNENLPPEIRVWSIVRMLRSRPPDVPTNTPFIAARPKFFQLKIVSDQARIEVSPKTTKGDLRYKQELRQPKIHLLLPNLPPHSSKTRVRPLLLSIQAKRDATCSPILGLHRPGNQKGWGRSF